LSERSPVGLKGCGSEEEKARLERNRVQIKDGPKSQNAKLRFYSECGRKLLKSCD
jgi:hypothetical protein